MIKGWVEKTLDEVCDIARGGSPRPIKSFITDDPNGINWIKISDATASSKYIYETKQKIKPEGIQRSRLVNEGDFILSNSMSFGRPYIMRTSGCIHDGWLVLSDKAEYFDQDYLYYFLGSPKAYKQFDSKAAGSTVRNLNIDLVKTVKVPLPSISEQERIVAILDEAFAGIDQAIANTERNLASARELFESYINTIFTQKGEGWKEEKLGDICEIKGRIGYRGYTKSDLVEKGDGAITLSPSNIKNNKFNTEKCTYISWFKYEESPEIMVFEGDILFVKTGSTYGKVALVENLPEKATINPQFVVFKNIKCFNRFLYYNSITKTFKKQIESIVGGSATPTLSQSNLAEQLISIPPTSKQQSIVKTLDTLRGQTIHLEKIYQQKLISLNELKESLLQKAFSGELTADLADETAEAAE